MSAGEAPRYRPLPAQVIECADGALIKRGSTEVRISGEGAAAVLTELLRPRPGGATREQLCQDFPPDERAGIAALAGMLVERRLLVAADESIPDDAETPTGVFWWDF